MDELNFDIEEINGNLHCVASGKGKSFIFEKLVEDAKKKGYNVVIK